MKTLIRSTKLQTKISATAATTVISRRNSLVTIVGVPGPQGPPGSGGGASAITDGLTIEGTGIAADPLRTTADVLLASRRLSEFDTQTAKNEARDNLGLNILDGGTFS